MSSGISGGEAIRDWLTEARTIGIHGQVVEPVGPICLFLPPLLVDFRHSNFSGLVRILHIA
jgi:hypothetical protein